MCKEVEMSNKVHIKEKNREPKYYVQYYQIIQKVRHNHSSTQTVVNIAIIFHIQVHI